jgi:hypothetical protein
VTDRVLAGLLGLLVVSTTGLLLAACSSPGPQSAPATAPGARATTTTTTAGPATTTTTLPAAATTGPLQLGGAIDVPLAAVQVAAAEGPDGAVFVAAQNPGSAQTSVVWVVDGNGPAAVAEHVDNGVAALAADANNLYVASYSGVTAFSRSTGNRDAHWALPPVHTANSSNDDLVSMTASGGRVLVSITQQAIQRIYRINPASKAAPHLVAQGASATFGPNGSVFYERSDDHLVKVSDAGVSTVGPLLANAPNGLGGGVQFIDVAAGGVLWVSEPAGQGEDAQFSEYDETTLHLIKSFGGSATEQIVDSVAGALVLSAPDSAVTCAQPSPTAPAECLSRLSGTGVVSDAISVGSAFVLLGPDPAVIAENATLTALELQRVS